MFVRWFCLDTPKSGISAMKSSPLNRRMFGQVRDMLVSEMALVVVCVASPPIHVTLIVQIRVVGSCGMISFGSFI